VRCPCLYQFLEQVTASQQHKNLVLKPNVQLISKPRFFLLQRRYNQRSLESLGEEQAEGQRGEAAPQPPERLGL